jgi:hypothetical protein
VGDYMKGTTEVKAASQMALQIMRWVADHSIPHRMLQFPTTWAAAAHSCSRW